MSTRLDALKILGDEIRLRESVLASELTTFALGAHVPLVVEPKNPQAAGKLLGLLQAEGIAWRPLGAGSNVLLPDSELNILVVRLGLEFSRFYKLSSSEAEKSLIEMAAKQIGFKTGGSETGKSNSYLVWGGASLMGLSRKFSGHGLSGLEFAAGIPGSLGGGIKMNCGAHGSEISTIVRRCLIADVKGNLWELTRDQIGFSYRHTNLPADCLVLAAQLDLAERPVEEVMQHRTECLEYRRKTQPLHLPSAGSVFKNPSRDPANPGTIAELKSERTAAAALIEEVGLKGFKCGGVQFSEMHANWLVKSGAAGRSAEARELIAEAQRRVQENFGIFLEAEIQLW